LALTQIERWQIGRHLLGVSLATETWLTVFAGVAMIAAVILMFHSSAERRKSERRLKKNIHKLSIDIMTERRHFERRLKQDTAELTAANEKLRQELAELKPKVGAAEPSAN
jgi:C4-dicarboxylate-specific signal transduction histidine kinase